jgi:hypothetical protein
VHVEVEVKPAFVKTLIPSALKSDINVTPLEVWAILEVNAVDDPYTTN